MAANIVIANYSPHEGKDDALRALIARHLPALREAGLITDRPAMLMRSQDGTYLEIFEWVDEAAPGKAHEHPVVGKLWGEMGEVADFVPLKDRPEAGQPFGHFELVEL